MVMGWGRKSDTGRVCEETRTENLRSKANVIMNPPSGLRHRWESWEVLGSGPGCPQNKRQADKAQAKLSQHMPNTCWLICLAHAGHMQHASSPWLACATRTHLTAFVGGITRILATTSQSSWSRAPL